MKIDKQFFLEKLRLVFEKLKELKKISISIIKKYTSKATWEELLLPENPKEHPRMMRFLFLTLVLSMIVTGLSFFLTFNIARISIPTVRVPAVTQVDITQAISILQSARLNSHFEMVYDNNIPKYEVIRQTPSQGTSVREGREVQLVISLGTDQYEVPELCNLFREEAINILNQSRIPFAIQVVPAKDREIDKVIAMSLPAGQNFPRDTTLTITVTDEVLENQYRMDNFIRQPLEFAANTLFNNKITPIIITTNVESLSDDGLVIDQSIADGTILLKNTSAILTVGLYAYNEGDRQKMRWHFFSYQVPRIDGNSSQIIITNDDGFIEEINTGERTKAKFYRAIVEDEIGRTRTIYERMGAEGLTFNRVFKAYGRAKVYVYADNEIIGSKEYGQ